MPGPRTLDSKTVKSLSASLGADLCGIASASSFSDAPDGFKPDDVYVDCRSVIVFACRIPPHSLDVDNRVLYSHASNAVFLEVDQIGLKLSKKLLDYGVSAIPVPCDSPYDYWEPERTYGRGTISMRHAGHIAGLGVIGNKQ